MLLLAQLLPEPGTASSIGWLVLSLAGLAVAATQIRGWLRSENGKTDERTIGGQPIRIKADRDCATDEQLDALRREINGTLMDVYTKLNATANGLAAVTAISSRHDEQLAEIRADIKQLYKGAGGHQ